MVSDEFPGRVCGAAGGQRLAEGGRGPQQPRIHGFWGGGRARLGFFRGFGVSCSGSWVAWTETRSLDLSLDLTGQARLFLTTATSQRPA